MDGWMDVRDGCGNKHVFKKAREIVATIGREIGGVGDADGIGDR
jgi:hypothetical protein